MVTQRTPAETTPRMQYTAASFAAPLVAAFRPAVPVHEEREVAAFHVHPRDPVLDVIGGSLWRRVRTAAFGLRVLQTGRIRWYLFYLIVTLLGLLVYLLARRTR